LISQSLLLGSEKKDEELDKLIYEFVQDGQREDILNEFENTTLKAVVLKSKLDIKIDETILALENLKYLRRHIESAYAFANRLVNNNATNDQLKRYIVLQLDSAIQQVEQTLDHKAKSETKP